MSDVTRWKGEESEKSTRGNSMKQGSEKWLLSEDQRGSGVEDIHTKVRRGQTGEL